MISAVEANTKCSKDRQDASEDMGLKLDEIANIGLTTVDS